MDRKRLNTQTTVPGGKKIKLTLNSAIKPPVVGTIALCEPSEGNSQQIKLGFVTITSKIIRNKLPEVLGIPFYAVTIHKGTNGSIQDLGKFLFTSKKYFTEFKKADLAVKVHTKKKIPFRSLIDQGEIVISELAQKLKGLALVQFRLNLEIDGDLPTSKGEKPTDRERAAEAILCLYPTKEDKPLVYTNEGRIITKLPRAVHGDLDLLFGVGLQQCSLVILKDVTLTETKKVDTSLGARRLRKKSGADLEGWDLAQPVMEVILIGQIQQAPTICFYMTKKRFRPFLYFPKEDVMLSTIRSYAWKYDTRIGLRGCIFLDILLGGSWKKAVVPAIAAPPTNFLQACAERKISIQGKFSIVVGNETKKPAVYDSDDSEEDLRVDWTDYMDEEGEQEEEDDYEEEEQEEDCTDEEEEQEDNCTDEEEQEEEAE